ncbi:ring finger domain-containing protein [Ditylenchus destructor]|uniref:Ring finger domain-containing protein n=1 Tax=Ditylenchus destructor TaxID=166010 RepID=A0AAD4MVH3_9BILA|nr:ring finger domain-containing protein [Ditylenchus destructor]
MPVYLCIICDEELNDKKDICSPPCGHVYHTECLTDWWKRRKTCPICAKRILSSRHFRKLFFMKEPLKLEPFDPNKEPEMISLDDDDIGNSLLEAENATLKDQLAKCKADNEVSQNHVHELGETNRHFEQQVRTLRDEIRTSLEKNENLINELRSSDDKAQQLSSEVRKISEKNQNLVEELNSSRAKVYDLEAKLSESKAPLAALMSVLEETTYKVKNAQIARLQHLVDSSEAELEAERERWKVECQQVREENECLLKQKELESQECVQDREVLRRKLEMSQENFKEMEKKCVEHCEALLEHKRDIEQSKARELKLYQENAALTEKLLNSEHKYRQLEEKVTKYENKIAKLAGKTNDRLDALKNAFLEAGTEADESENSREFIYQALTDFLPEVTSPIKERKRRSLLSGLVQIFKLSGNTSKRFCSIDQNNDENDQNGDRDTLPNEDRKELLLKPTQEQNITTNMATDVKEFVLGPGFNKENCLGSSKITSTPNCDVKERKSRPYGFSFIKNEGSLCDVDPIVQRNSINGGTQSSASYTENRPWCKKDIWHTAVRKSE